MELLPPRRAKAAGGGLGFAVVAVVAGGCRARILVLVAAGSGRARATGTAWLKFVRVHSILVRGTRRRGRAVCPRPRPCRARCA